MTFEYVTGGNFLLNTVEHERPQGEGKNNTKRKEEAKWTI